MIILRYHDIFFRLTAPRSPGMAAGAVSLRKSHDIVILSFCNIVKGQAKYMYFEKVSPTKYNRIGMTILTSNLYDILIGLGPNFLEANDVMFR